VLNRVADANTSVESRPSLHFYVLRYNVAAGDVTDNRGWLFRLVPNLFSFQIFDRNPSSVVVKSRSHVRRRRDSWVASAPYVWTGYMLCTMKYERLRCWSVANVEMDTYD